LHDSRAHQEKYADSNGSKKADIRETQRWQGSSAIASQTMLAALCTSIQLLPLKLCASGMSRENVEGTRTQLTRRKPVLTLRGST
jgi:hypothetical protein